jgi:hypothetical protein
MNILSINVYPYVLYFITIVSYLHDESLCLHMLWIPAPVPDPDPGFAGMTGI